MNYSLKSAFMRQLIPIHLINIKFKEKLYLMKFLMIREKINKNCMKQIAWI